MSAYFDIAYAASSKRLCLFLGTGFSKAVTGKKAPSWQELLEECCDLLDDKNKLKDALFPEDEPSPLTLEEAAQVVSIELEKKNISLHEAIANIISKLKLKGENKEVKTFISTHDIDVVTTNYDTLFEQLSEGKTCHSIYPGMPIPRSSSDVRVYHIHGSIESPSNMVVTSEDYFRFINGQSYFSRKLSTLLHENTVVIIGYSLGDTNIKAIINDYNLASSEHAAACNIFFVSRRAVDRHIKDYYSHCYGIRVIDEVEVDVFFKELNEMVGAVKDAKRTVKNINSVFNDGAHFTDKYLRVENSLFEILASISAIGRSLTNEKVTTLIGTILAKKKELTQENSAWEQYAHLARWLVHIGSIVDVSEDKFKKIYLDAVEYSMRKMSRQRVYGCSWQAYEVWKNGWSDIRPKNRKEIRTYILDNRPSDMDALSVVNKG